MAKRPSRSVAVWPMTSSSRSPMTLAYLCGGQNKQGRASKLHIPLQGGGGLCCFARGDAAPAVAVQASKPQASRRQAAQLRNKLASTIAATSASSSMSAVMACRTHMTLSCVAAGPAPAPPAGRETSSEVARLAAAEASYMAAASRPSAVAFSPPPAGEAGSAAAASGSAPAAAAPAVPSASSPLPGAGPTGSARKEQPARAGMPARCAHLRVRWWARSARRAKSFGSSARQSSTRPGARRADTTSERGVRGLPGAAAAAAAAAGGVRARWISVSCERTAGGGGVSTGAPEDTKPGIHCAPARPALTSRKSVPLLTTATSCRC